MSTTHIKERNMETEIQRICREVKERRAYIVAHPDEFSLKELQDAQHAIYQSERLSLAATLRYDD